MPPQMPAMNFRPRNPTPIREKNEVNKFKELQEILDKLFKGVFSVIAFKDTDIGKALFMTHANVMMVMVLMIVLFFLVWLLGTMLRERIGCFLIIPVFIMLVIGSLSSVLVLVIISSHIAWFASLLWIVIFSVIAYYYYQELHKLVACAVSDSIKILLKSYKRESTQLPV